MSLWRTPSAPVPKYRHAPILIGQHGDKVLPTRSETLALIARERDVSLPLEPMAKTMEGGLQATHFDEVV